MTSAQHMEMKMKYALPAMSTGIDDEAVPVAGNPFLFGDFIADQHETPE